MNPKLGLWPGPLHYGQEFPASEFANEYIQSVAEMSGKVKLHLRLGEPSADSLDWYGNLPIHHAVTCDPPNIGKVKDLMQNYPSGVRTRNQFGFVKILSDFIILL